MKRDAGTRACLAVSASVMAFALLVETAGLLPAVMATVSIALLGAGVARARQVLLFAAGIAAAVAVLFVGLLGQPIALIAGF